MAIMLDTSDKHRPVYVIMTVADALAQIMHQGTSNNHANAVVTIVSHGLY